jgi:hypothetical protein
LPFELKYTEEAQFQFDALSKEKGLSRRFKSVRKALRLLAQDPTYPGLNTHKYDSIEGPEKTEVFEAYAENKTPAAYRIFWCYYPAKKEGDAMGTITILSITPHP